MAVKRYDGSAWQTVAGLGAQGPAATSSSIATWVKTATGGETSVSGNDDNSQPLSYTVGQELVFINGALQKRGADYTATTGNSITGLTALAANDVVTVWTVNAFSVTNAISNTLVDAKGDLIVATGADTPGRLAVGSNGQVLTVDSTTGTGLKWATPAAGGYTELASGSLSSGTTTINAIAGTYRDLVLVMTDVETTSASGLRLRVRNDSGNNYRGVAIRNVSGVPNLENNGVATAFVSTAGYAIDTGSNDNTWIYRFYNYADTTCFKLVSFIGRFKSNSSGAFIECDFRGTYIQTTAIDEINIINESSTFSGGSYKLYGVK